MVALTNDSSPIVTTRSDNLRPTMVNNFDPNWPKTFQLLQLKLVKTIRSHVNFRYHADATQAFPSCPAFPAAVLGLAGGAPVELRPGRGVGWDQGFSEAGGPEGQSKASTDPIGPG